MIMIDIQKMNMRKMIDNVVEEFRQKLENELTPPESTKFLCIDTNGEIIIVDSETIPAGTLIGGENWEAFRTLVLFDHEKPWVLSTNLKMSHEIFTETMRGRRTLPKIIHWGHR